MAVAQDAFRHTHPVSLAIHEYGLKVKPQEWSDSLEHRFYDVCPHSVSIHPVSRRNLPPVLLLRDHVRDNPPQKEIGPGRYLEGKETIFLASEDQKCPGIRSQCCDSWFATGFRREIA
jgi:hypothetical protein